MRKTGIARGPRPAISNFQTKRENVITYMGKNLLLNSINRSSAIRIYSKKVVILYTKFLHRQQHDQVLNSYFTQ